MVIIDIDVDLDVDVAVDVDVDVGLFRTPSSPLHCCPWPPDLTRIGELSHCDVRFCFDP